MPSDALLATPPGPPSAGARGPDGPPDIAVVIPAHRQPGLLPEAVASVLAQRGARRVAAVIVDDGCPLAETRETGLRLTREAPGRVHVLRRANGGLAAARNTGIAFALAAWPACQGVFFLDADNRMGPRLVERSADMLQASPPGIGWVVPDLDGFGDRANYSTAGDHSVFLHLLENGHDAGALVARAVFDAGLRFDETLRDGFEDWDFWLRCAAAGFRGRHVPEAGFLYRRRAGGMRRGAESRRAALVDALRRRLSPLIRPRGLLALEATEVPRFLLYRVGMSEVGLVVDPLHPRHPPEGRARIRRRIVEAGRRPAAVHVPPMAVFASDPALGTLFRARILHSGLWAAARALRGADAVTVHLVASADDELTIRRGEAAGAAALILARTDRLTASGGPATALTFALPKSVDLPSLPDVAADRAAEAEALRDTLAERQPDLDPWRGDWRRSRSRAAEGYAEMLGTGAPLPWMGSTGARDIALVAPIFATGGVERVLLRYAEGLRARGWRPHLVLTGADRATLPPAALAAFETVSFPPAAGMEGADPERDYLGAAWPSGGATAADARDLLGLLAPMHAVLVTHALAGHAVAGALRDLGVRAWAGLHVAERGPDGVPNGNPHAFLPHEGSFDGVVAVSGAMRDALAGAGIPAAKIVVVPNGPGYPAAPGAPERALSDRRARGTGGLLRALFLGRLDGQKGLDRLRDVIALTRGRVAWRVVGRAVLDGGDAPGRDDLGAAVEPPPSDDPGLDDLYGWADLLVLPSRFEGSPLTAFEAARAGVPSVVTRTGALDEVVEDGVDGVLVADGPDAAVVAATADAVLALAADRARLARMGEAAFARAAALPGWDVRMAPWLDALDRDGAP